MKKFLLIFFIIIIITATSGCSLITKEVDYQKIADDLNKKKMSRILYPKKGYAKYSQDSYLIRSKSIKKDQVEKEENETYIHGTYNINNHTATGKAYKSYKLSIENKDSEKQKNKKDFPPVKVIYSHGKYTNTQNKKPMDVSFIFDKLQGLEKIKPTHYQFGLDEPPSVGYKLTEREFSQIINDNLKIKYDRFKSSSIYIGLTKDGNKLYIHRIDVSVEYQKNEDGTVIDYFYNNSLYPNRENYIQY